MNKKKPMRMCVGCQQMKEKCDMIRVLKMQDDTFCVDSTGKKNGRGAYLCKDSNCLTLAWKNHGLERSFKRSIPKDTMEILKKEMEQIAK